MSLVGLQFNTGTSFPHFFNLTKNLMVKLKRPNRQENHPNVFFFPRAAKNIHLCTNNSSWTIGPIGNFASCLGTIGKFNIMVRFIKSVKLLTFASTVIQPWLEIKLSRWKMTQHGCICVIDATQCRVCIRIYICLLFFSVFQCFRSGTHVSFLNSTVLLQSSLAKETTVFSLSFRGCLWYLVNGLFRPHISRLDTSPK